jgi:hypothetical protein
MNRKRVIGVALLAGLVGACATTGDRGESEGEPAWIAGNSESYPAAAYLLGRGRAQSGERARDRARADLAKIFEVAVEEVTRDVQAFRQIDDDGVEGRVAELDVERRLRTRTDQVLEGVEIVDQWRDPETGAYHALAAMERSRAIQRLRAEIGELDEATGVWVERARERDELLARIDAASRAVALQRQRRALQRQLRAISRTGTGVSSEWQLERLIGDRDELRNRLRVAVVAHGDAGQRVSGTARSVASDAGLTVTDDGDYRLVVRMSTDTIGPRDGWYWRIGSLAVELVGPDGTTHGGWRWPLKVAAAERALLEQRVDATVAEHLETGLERALAGLRGGETG